MNCSSWIAANAWQAVVASPASVRLKAPRNNINIIIQMLHFNAQPEPEHSDTQLHDSACERGSQLMTTHTYRKPHQPTQHDVSRPARALQ